MVPDAEAYNALLKGLVRQRKFRSAEELLGTMRTERLWPCPGTSWEVAQMVGFQLRGVSPGAVVGVIHGKSHDPMNDLNVE